MAFPANMVLWEHATPSAPATAFSVAQLNGFDPADSTAPSPSSSRQTLLSNPASYAHTTSHGLPQQSWPDENSNDSITRNVEDTSSYGVAVMVKGEAVAYVHGCRSKDECIVRVDFRITQLSKVSTQHPARTQCWGPNKTQ
ncbi:hypothetical protein BBP40_001531 [Aspergillus hancockii]|nr:hypothetical protein BBP40_001531 [Aspergillus hancockii]